MYEPMLNARNSLDGWMPTSRRQASRYPRWGRVTWSRPDWAAAGRHFGVDTTNNAGGLLGRQRNTAEQISPGPTGGQQPCSRRHETKDQPALRRPAGGPADNT